MAARILCCIVLIMEIRGFTLCPRGRIWAAVIFYTLLSNLITSVSALLIVILGQRQMLSSLRYLSTCMLIMTFLVTVCVLVPMGGDPKKLLFSGNGLYHHLLCPVVSSVSYILAERHAPGGLVWLPVSFTLVYGLIMLFMNAKGIVDGPYPFFRVRHQSATATVLWTVVLLAAITGISAAVHLAAG
ncbi:MAG: hypothetical protein IKE62_03835 [Oscillospiraceae bacterium]|nr:hypothetical protein [Oscillospiraceae bacterium]